ncbi:MAG: creatininase family protein [Armatimonadetes bacterium]|nr:creatininase family protein [Armatimonadota bacterium]
MSRDRFLQALNAEGVFAVAYVNDANYRFSPESKPLEAGGPIHLRTIFQERNLYGKGCPFQCPHVEHPPVYRRGDLPVSEAIAERARPHRRAEGLTAMDEVRFDRMVPSAIRARRDACNLAYLPVGSLEWHGPHMPFGTDYMTVTHLAEAAARRFGGIVFPPIFYGDVRYHLQECRLEWRQTYVREMDVPEAYAEAFPLQNEDGSYGYGCPTQPDDGPLPDEALPFSLAEQSRFFEQFIARTLLTIHLYGFRRILLLPGHGPNPGYCRAAEEVYRANVARRTAFGPPAKTLTWFYIEAAKEAEPLLKNHWIHADKWEGSITMVAAPGTVHPELLPEDRGTLAPAYLGHPYLTETDGYNPEYRSVWYSFDALDPRNGTSEEYGRVQVEAILKELAEVVAGLMARG